MELVKWERYISVNEQVEEWMDRQIDKGRVVYISHTRIELYSYTQTWTRQIAIFMGR
jgi:hypothetical protein